MLKASPSLRKMCIRSSWTYEDLSRDLAGSGRLQPNLWTILVLPQSFLLFVSYNRNTCAEILIQFLYKFFSNKINFFERKRDDSDLRLVLVEWKRKLKDKRLWQSRYFFEINFLLIWKFYERCSLRILTWYKCLNKFVLQTNLPGVSRKTIK